MKKIFSGLLAFIILTIFNIYVAPHSAASEKEIKIFVDGEYVESEKKPIIENGRTLVPIRAVAERSGIDVLWDADKRTVTLSDVFAEATVTIDKREMTVYHSVIDSLERVELDVSPKIIDGSTYVTLRAMLEAVGCGVLWDDAERSVYVVSPSSMQQYKLTAKGLEEILEEYREYASENIQKPTIDNDKAEENDDSLSEDNQNDDENFETLPKDESSEEKESTDKETTDKESTDKETTDKESTDKETTDKDSTEEESTDDDSEHKESEDGDDNASVGENGGDSNGDSNDDGNGNDDDNMEKPTIDGEETEDNSASSGEADKKETVNYTEMPKGSDHGMRFSGFRKMTGNSIKQGTLFSLYGKVSSENPIISVRIFVTDSEIDVSEEISPEEEKTSYNIYSGFNKKISLASAGVGAHTMVISARTTSSPECVLFTLDYTVEEVPNYVPPKNVQEDEDADSDTKDKSNVKDEEDEEESEANLTYYGFRTMSGNKITEGAPHGLYGTITADTAITRVRCIIDGTDMDYSVSLPARDDIKSYNVFTYFDKLIRFSEAGLGRNTFRVYAAAKGTEETLLFSYSYTVLSKEEKAEEEKPPREPVDVTSPDIPDSVCLPLKGGIRLTSPYGFRAYNKWEFHKGIDMVSDSSLDIIAVADGEVVDCSMGKNSGAGNYVAIQHDEGWVSLYYHLKSYTVEKGDRVKMGEVIATMGNSGGNYGVHLHFMTCDDWYGTLWETQNNHHTAPHEYVPQILTAVKNYNPSYEKENKDKVIMCNFHLPHEIKKGTAFALSGVGGQAASQTELSRLTVKVFDKDGEEIISEYEENPESTTDGYYIYTDISVDLDKRCHFDKLPKGEYVFRLFAETKNGREREIYTKAFEIN